MNETFRVRDGYLVRAVVPALGRKSKGASAAVYEDGMLEYHALREKHV